MGRRWPADDPGARVRDDTGGVWIVTGWVVGLLVYVGIVLAWHAGFTAAAALVAIPAVLAIMIGAGNLIGGRPPHRPPPRFNRPEPVVLDSLRSDGVPAPTASGADGSPAEGSGTAR